MSTFLLQTFKYCLNRTKKQICVNAHLSISKGINYYFGKTLINTITTLPLLKQKKCLLVFNTGKPNSKSKILLDELETNGLNLEHVLILSNTSLSSKLFRCIVRTPIIIYLSIKYYWTLRNKRIDLILFLITIKIVEMFVKKNPKLVIAILSDTTQQMAIFAYASYIKSGSLLWWQDDFHHKYPFMFSPKYAAVLNQTGYNSLAKASGKCFFFKRSINEICADFATIPNLCLKVGILVNAFFTGRKSEIDTIKKTLQNFNINKIQIRLHPRIVSNSVELPDFLEISTHSSIEEFLKDQHLILAGNTASILKSLSLKTPVIYTPGLDPLEDDIYKFSDRLLVYSVSTHTDVTIKSINTFYHNNFNKEKFYEIMSFDAITEVKLQNLSKLRLTI